jgi:hypothetical protein
MTEIRLEIKYGTNEVTGGCIQCRAEQELYNCLRVLLVEEQSEEEIKEKYALLISFLQSPELVKMRVKSEKYLSEGKQVILVLRVVDGKSEYILEVN